MNIWLAMRKSIGRAVADYQAIYGFFVYQEDAVLCRVIFPPLNSLTLFSRA